MVAFKPKRARYTGYKNPDFSSESIKNFIDDILGGGGEWHKVEEGELFLNEEAKKGEL